MSAVPHTPEPWHAGRGGMNLIVYDAQGWAVCDAKVYHFRHSEPETAAANAARIAACVNACAGIENPAEGVVPLSLHNERLDDCSRLQDLISQWELKAANWFASPEAAKQLDGYRELGMRAAAAESLRDELLAALDMSKHLRRHADDEDGPCLCSTCVFVTARDLAFAKVQP